MPAFAAVQGIDLKAGGRNKKKHRTAPKSENVYLKLLVKVRTRARTPGPPSTAPGQSLCPGSHAAEQPAGTCALLCMLHGLLPPPPPPLSPGTHKPPDLQQPRTLKP